PRAVVALGPSHRARRVIGERGEVVLGRRVSVTRPAHIGIPGRIDRDRSGPIGAGPRAAVPAYPDLSTRGVVLDRCEIIRAVAGDEHVAVSVDREGRGIVVVAVEHGRWTVISANPLLGARGVVLDRRVIEVGAGPGALSGHVDIAGPVHDQSGRGIHTV